MANPSQAGGSTLQLLQRAKMARNQAAQALRLSPSPSSSTGLAAPSASGSAAPQRGAVAPLSSPQSGQATPENDLLSLTRTFFATLTAPP
jgi:hypothetical protein